MVKTLFKLNRTKRLQKEVKRAIARESKKQSLSKIKSRQDALEQVMQRDMSLPPVAEVAVYLEAVVKEYFSDNPVDYSTVEDFNIGGLSVEQMLSIHLMKSIGFTLAQISKHLNIYQSSLS
ncbi:hypothetical protein, partial [Lysinibacillus xylanilyticus]|uniref:hypothetical protein n=1 Tax=Lysinibacillus xylanilyticus TaxID=582475 RepID=UPI0036DF472F